jgi:hypothetical protein
MSTARSRTAARKPAAAYQRGEHLYRRGKVWYARGGILGREGVSLHTRDPGEASERLRALVARTRDKGRPANRRGAGDVTRTKTPLAATVAA